MASNCCNADVKAVHTVTGTTITSQYFDLRVDPPVLIDKATFDALNKVKCPITESDWENVCLQPIGNTDAANIVEGMKLLVKQTTFADVDGTVADVAIVQIELYLADGTKVTGTHEQVTCPTPLIIETEACVA